MLDFAKAFSTILEFKQASDIPDILFIVGSYKHFDGKNLRSAIKKDLLLVNYQLTTGEAGRSIEKQLQEDRQLSLKTKRQINGLRMHDIGNRDADFDKIIASILATKSTVVLDRA